MLNALRTFLLILAVAPQGEHLHLPSRQERTEPFAQESEHLQNYQNNYLGVCVSVSSESPLPKKDADVRLDSSSLWIFCVGQSGFTTYTGHTDMGPTCLEFWFLRLASPTSHISCGVKRCIFTVN